MVLWWLLLNCMFMLFFTKSAKRSLAKLKNEMKYTKWRTWVKGSSRNGYFRSSEQDSFPRGGHEAGSLHPLG